MKKGSLILGIIFTILGSFQTGKYLFYYTALTDYGKGFVWGSILLIAVGILLIKYGLKRKKSST